MVKKLELWKSIGFFPKAKDHGLRMVNRFGAIYSECRFTSKSHQKIGCRSRKFNPAGFAR